MADSMARFKKWLEQVLKRLEGKVQSDCGGQDTVLCTTECQGMFEAGKWHNPIYFLDRPCFGNVGNEIYLHGRKVKKKGVTRWEAFGTSLVRDGMALT